MPGAQCSRLIKKVIIKMSYEEAFTKHFIDHTDELIEVPVKKVKRDKQEHIKAADKVWPILANDFDKIYTGKK